MKKIISYIIIITGCLLPCKGFSQFINIQLEVTPEVESLVEQPLDFGQIITGSGLQRIEPGDSNMGIFKLNALRTQSLIVNLEADDELNHTNPSVRATIPVHLQASYTNNGINNVRNSVPLENFNENIIIKGPPSNPNSTWSAVYIYVFGSIDIGNVPAGNYRGEIILTVIYN